MSTDMLRRPTNRRFIIIIINSYITSTVPSWATFLQLAVYA